MNFLGIIPEISGNISQWGDFGISVMFQGIFWDIVAEFDVSPYRTRQGEYCCSLCVDAYENGYAEEKPIYYSSRKKLWIQHCYEPFLKWANDNLNSSHCLCLQEIEGGGITWAKIKTLEEAKVGSWKFIIPLVKDK